jgi:hypothetical protein
LHDLSLRGATGAVDLGKDAVDDIRPRDGGRNEVEFRLVVDDLDFPGDGVDGEDAAVKGLLDTGEEVGGFCGGVDLGAL